MVGSPRSNRVSHKNKKDPLNKLAQHTSFLKLDVSAKFKMSFESLSAQNSLMTADLMQSAWTGEKR